MRGCPSLGTRTWSDVLDCSADALDVDVDAFIVPSAPVASAGGCSVRARRAFDCCRTASAADRHRPAAAVLRFVRRRSRLASPVPLPLAPPPSSSSLLSSDPEGSDSFEAKEVDAGRPGARAAVGPPPSTGASPGAAASGSTPLRSRNRSDSSGSAGRRCRCHMPPPPGACGGRRPAPAANALAAARTAASRPPTAVPAFDAFAASAAAPATAGRSLGDRLTGAPAAARSPRRR